MGDEQDRLAVALKLAKEFHHLVAAARVERPGGLIGEQERGIIDQGPRNRDALLLAAAQTSRVATGDVCDAELVQQLPGAARRGIALQLRGDKDVLERGQVGEQVEELKDEADVVAPKPGQPCLAQLAEVP